MAFPWQGSACRGGESEPMTRLRQGQSPELPWLNVLGGARRLTGQEDSEGGEELVGRGCGAPRCRSKGRGLLAVEGQVLVGRGRALDSGVGAAAEGLQVTQVRVERRRDLVPC